MAQRSGGGGFGWFVIGVAVGAAGMYWGPSQYQQYLQQGVAPGQVRMEVEPSYIPGQWRRMARFDIEFSTRKANGQNWDWPMTDPELQLCIREGSEFRKCFGPLDPELAPCKGRFRCTTSSIAVPGIPFTIELNEWDDYNKPDPIGVVQCDVGQTCKFSLGIVTVRDAGSV